MRENEANKVLGQPQPCEDCEGGLQLQSLQQKPRKGGARTWTQLSQPQRHRRLTGVEAKGKSRFRIL